MLGGMVSGIIGQVFTGPFALFVGLVIGFAAGIVTGRFLSSYG
jgi:hypothetical protein